MESKPGKSPEDQHSAVRDRYDEVLTDGRYEEGMARMALYHRHCQDPVIFRTLGDVRGKTLLDLACGDGFYTRRFRSECAADPVIGVDLSPKQIEGRRGSSGASRWASSTKVGDVTTLELDRRFDVVTAIHLLHYLENEAEIESALSRVYDLLVEEGSFVTMIANPECDLDQHDPLDSKTKFGYYISLAEAKTAA